LRSSIGGEITDGDEARPIAANIAKLPINDAVALRLVLRVGAVLVAVATATPTPIPITMAQTNIVSVKSISADTNGVNQNMTSRANIQPASMVISIQS
jgi:hypothetical protein